MKTIKNILEKGDVHDSKRATVTVSEIALTATRLFESSCDLLLKSTEICKLQANRGEEVAHAFEIVRKIVDSSPAKNSQNLAHQNLVQQALHLAHNARKELARAALEIRSYIGDETCLTRLYWHRNSNERPNMVELAENLRDLMQLGTGALHLWPDDKGQIQAVTDRIVNMAPVMTAQQNLCRKMVGELEDMQCRVSAAICAVI